MASAPIAPDPARGTRPSLRRWAPHLTALSVLLVGAVYGVDVATGADVACTLLYLGPVGLAAWAVGRRAGLAVALLSASLSAVVRMGGHAPRRPGVFAWNSITELAVFVGVGLLLDALRAQFDKQVQLAESDPLTGLLNRRAFELVLGDALRDGSPLTMVFVDVDDFKAHNDKFGHAHGDTVLAEVGGALRRSVRRGDAVVRLGGDEFGLLMVGAGSAAAKGRLADLDRALEALHAGVSVSVGAVTFESPPRRARDVIEGADRAMYRAKRERAGSVHTVVDEVDS